jgi:hypothetical protein
MVDRRNLLLCRRCRQRVLAELAPYTQIIFSIDADCVLMAAQRIVLHTKFRCDSLQLGPISQ